LGAGFVAAAILGLIGVLAEIIGRVIQGGISADPEVVNHVKEIEDLRRKAGDVRGEIEALQRRSADAQGILTEARLNAKAAERRAALVRIYHRLIVENGAPGPGLRRYDASVSHPKAGMEESKAEQRKMINPIYQKEVQVIIWANSEEAAEKKFIALFPRIDGFDTTFHGAVFGAGNG